MTPGAHSQPLQEVTFRLFEPGDATAFRELNEQWIQEFFTLEENDRLVLGDPERYVLGAGGHAASGPGASGPGAGGQGAGGQEAGRRGMGGGAIAMAVEGSRAVGCCALIPMGGGSYELVKMTIAADRRGMGLGRRLLAFVIDHARAIQARRLYLETNTRLANAIHLYESAGFRRVPPDHPTPYSRVDVFMELTLDSTG